MLNRKFLHLGSVSLAIVLITFGLSNIGHALFHASSIENRLLKPITIPKIAKVEHSNFQLDPSAFSYERQMSPSRVYEISSIGIESAKLMGTVIGHSKSEHVAFVTLPNSSSSKMVKVGDEIMDHLCLDIHQHAIIFESSPNDVILHLSGFGPEKNVMTSTTPEEPEPEASQSDVEGQQDLSLSQSPEVTADKSLISNMSTKEKKLEERFKDRPELLEKMKKKRKRMLEKKLNRE